MATKYYDPGNFGPNGIFHFIYNTRYEIYSSGGWERKLFIDQVDFSDIERKMRAEEIRIPCLTQDQIELYGFIYNEKRDEFESKRTFLGVSTGDDKKLIIAIDFEDAVNYASIFYRSNRGEEFVKYEGPLFHMIHFEYMLKLAIGIENYSKLIR